MGEEKAVEQMTNEELVDEFEIESFEYGSQTDRGAELEAEILRRMEKFEGK